MEVASLRVHCEGIDRSDVVFGWDRSSLWSVEMEIVVGQDCGCVLCSVFYGSLGQSLLRLLNKEMFI